VGVAFSEGPKLLPFYENLAKWQLLPLYAHILSVTFTVLPQTHNFVIAREAGVRAANPTRAARAANPTRNPTTLIAVEMVAAMAAAARAAAAAAAAARAEAVMEVVEMER
jgi:hypothetical protein